MSTNTNWSQLAVIHLRQALARRGLSEEGNKEVLIKRLEEMEKTANATTPDPVVLESSARLLKQKLISGCEATLALKTVIIDPFKRDLFQEANFVTWLDDADVFTIQKTGPECTAELIFKTVEKGDAAFTDFKQNMALSVTHPAFNVTLKRLTKKEKDMQTTLENKTKKQEPSAKDMYSGYLVVEGLTEELNTEEKLYEFFPEANTAISFQFDPISEGIALLEFENSDVAEKILGACGSQFTVEGSDLKLFKYEERCTLYNKRNIHYTKLRLSGDPTEILPNDERLKINKELQEIIHAIGQIHNSTDIFGYEKLVKFAELKEQLVEKRRNILRDTTQRLKAGETEMPEPDSEMMEQVRELVLKKQVTAGKSLRTASDPDLTSAQLEQFDKEYDQVVQEMEKIVSKIRSTEGQLTPLERQKRQKTSKLPPLTGKKHGGKSAATVQTVKVGAKAGDAGYIYQAQQQSAMKNQRATANLMQAAKSSIGGGRGAMRGGRGARGGSARGASRGTGDRGGGRGGARGRGTMQVFGGGRGGQSSGRGIATRGGGFARGAAGRGSGGDFGGYGGRGQKRPGSNFERGPPNKMGRGGHGGRGGFGNMSYEDPYSQGDGGYNGNYNGGGYDQGGPKSMKVIENITNALTDKMAKLEEMQQATMKSHAQLMQGQGGGSGPLLGRAPLSESCPPMPGMEGFGGGAGHSSGFGSGGSYSSFKPSSGGYGQGYGDGNYNDYSSPYSSSY